MGVREALQLLVPVWILSERAPFGIVQIGDPSHIVVVKLDAGQIQIRALSFMTVDRAVEAMASVIASAINILDVDTVILGGIWERFGGGLARRIEDRSRTQVLGYPESQVHVLLPNRTRRPALWGAAEMGLRTFVDDPLAFLDGRRSETAS